MASTPEMWLQQGFRALLGCASTVAEWLQDEQKRQAQLQQWQQQMQAWVQEMAAKGEKTEAEAREFVERLWHRQTPGPRSQPVEVTIQQESTPSQAAAQLQELTQELAALRASLEQSRPNDTA